MMGPSTPQAARGPGAPGSGQRFDPDQDQEFRPRQVVDSDVDEGLDAAMEFELGRKKSPPGRKPVPSYLPSSKREEESQRRWTCHCRASR